MKVAIVHELLTIRGGAERVARLLSEMFPEAPVYTLLYDEKKLGDWFPKERVRPSRLQPLAALSTNHHLYLPFFAGAAEAWDFSAFDLVISSSSAFAHGIKTGPKTWHLSYVHAPARYLWDRTHDVINQAAQGPLGPLKRFYLENVFHRLRTWDALAADRPHHLLAASQSVQRRIELYWRRQSEVLYPPIADAWFTSPMPHAREDEAPFVIVSTLARYKRIDLAIEACNALKVPLVIIGDGADKARLQSLAGPTVTFAGPKTHDEIRTIFSSARTLLFPGDEDFGLAAIEALASGLPVVAFQAGGALEWLTEKNGVFFPRPTVESLVSVLKNFKTTSINPEACLATAERFTEASFKKGVHAAIAEMMKAKR